MTSFEFDRYEHSTLLCALIHYGMAVAIPDECIALLEKISPNPTQPWAESMVEAREAMRKLNREAVREELEAKELEAQEVAAMRER